MIYPETVNLDEFSMTAVHEEPPVTLITLDSFFPEQMEQAVTGGTIDHVQVGKGRFLGRLLHADLGEAILDWGSYNLPLLAVGPMPPDRVTLGFVSSGDEAGTINGLRLERPSPVILGENSELHYRLAPDTRWAALQVTRGMLERLGVAVPSGRAFTPDADAGHRQVLSRTLDAAVAALTDIAVASPAVPDPGALMLSIQESLIWAFAAVMEPDPSSEQGSSVARSLGVARHAEEYLRANFQRQVKIAELCDSSCASLRTIERAFMEVHGVTPKQFLTLLRLKETRRRLLRLSHNDHSVAGIAAEAGFTHLGRFSVEYRRHFGESPRETLRRT